jgi:hypothetical protein
MFRKTRLPDEPNAGVTALFFELRAALSSVAAESGLRPSGAPREALKKARERPPPAQGTRPAGRVFFHNLLIPKQVILQPTWNQDHSS